MGILNESEILAIRQKADIVDIVSDYIPLTQKGKNYFAVCPFHDDHKPSMVVSKEKQIFNCFTCHTGGNVFTFVMNYENVSFIEAVKIIAKKVGIDVNIKTNTNVADKKYKDLYEIMNLSNKFYMNVLNTQTGVEAKKYLTKRGITEEIIKNFQIGLASDGKDELANFLSKHNYDLKLIESVGLINKSGLNIYDTFSNRIMIPITNEFGQIVGYTGRIYHNEDQAKYINTKETVIYKKGEILFNYFNAKPYIKKENKVIIVEGNMDAIKMYCSGVKNVIALMGTALSKYQINMLKKLRVPIVLMLDNDSAGLEATKRNGDLLKENNLEVEVIRLKDCKDPDEYIEKKGIKSFQDIIKSPIKYIDFKLNIIKQNKNLNSSEDLVNYIKEVTDIIKNEDDLTQKIIISKIAKETQIDENIISNQLQKKEAPVIIQQNSEQVKEVKESKYTVLAKKILYFMINDVKYITMFKNEIGYFENKKERDIFNEISFYYQNHPEGNIADLISYFESMSEKSVELKSIISQGNIDELNYDTYVECLRAIKKYNYELEIKNIKAKIKNEIDENEKIKLIERLTKLKKGSVENGRN